MDRGGRRRESLETQIAAAKSDEACDEIGVEARSGTRIQVHDRWVSRNWALGQLL